MFAMNMLLWNTHLSRDQWSLLPQLREIGYDAVEIPVFEGDESYYRDLGQEAKRCGLKVTAVSAVGPEFDPSSEDPQIREAALERMKWIIEMSHLLGAEILVGPFFAATGVFTPGLDYDAARKRSAAVIKEAARFAAKRGMQISLEFLNRFEVQLINCTEDTVNYIVLVDEPNVGVLYDTHHANIEENSISEVFRRYGHFINHIHFSESHRGHLGEGQVNWQETRTQVEQLNFKGCIAIEAFASDVPGFSEVVHVWRQQFGDKLDLASRALAFSRALTTKR